MHADQLEENFRRTARKASAFYSLLQEMHALVNAEVRTREKLSNAEEHNRLIEIQELLGDAITGLEGLHRANNREPFSA